MAVAIACKACGWRPVRADAHLGEGGYPETCERCGKPFRCDIPGEEAMTKPPTSDAAGAVLLPCPFCGAAVTLDRNQPKFIYHRPDDTTCPLAGRNVFTREWNRRSTPQPPPEAGSVGVPQRLSDKAKSSESSAGEILRRQMNKAYEFAAISAAPAPKESK